MNKPVCLSPDFDSLDSLVVRLFVQGPLDFRKAFRHFIYRE